MKDYQKTFTVDAPVNEVYDAITLHVADWWSNDLAGAAAQPGDFFNIAFGETRKTFDVIEVIPGRRVVWECAKAYIDMESLKNKGEWAGTKIFWSLTPAAGGTTLSLLHEGLNRSFECYDVCAAGWDQFLASLEAYLRTGTGMPYLKAQPVS